jgi:serine/threonine protein kinase
VDLDEFEHADELGPWQIGQEIGRGSNGVVHAATDRATGEKRAVKLLRPDGHADAAGDALVLREIDHCIALRHPGVVRSYAGGRAASGYFLVMELCEGGNLASAVVRNGPLPAATALSLFLVMLSGLEYAHSLPRQVMTKRGLINVTGLVHRDLKPANIFITDDSHAKVGDFGLAKAFEAAGLSGLTQSGFTAGTPAFMPRQQLLDYKYVSPAVDVWAAAASLYYALSGHSPRDFPPGRDPWRVVWDTPAVPLAHRDATVPLALERVLDHALADEKDDLPFATASDFRQAIEAACRTDQIQARTDRGHHD